MKILNFMVLKIFVPIFLLACIFFILILELVDLFANLWRYLNYDVPLKEIAKVALYYLPKCLSFAVPIALLFAISFSLGSLYANNELIAVFGSGISLMRFVLPLLFLGFLFSLGSFIFEEKIVIKTFKIKNELSKTLLKQPSSLNNSDITIISSDFDTVYHAVFYNDSSQSISGLSVVMFAQDGSVDRIVYADQARWENEAWTLSMARIFTWNEDRSFMGEQKMDKGVEPYLTEIPATFRKNVRNVEEMTMEEAEEWFSVLRKSGQDFRGSLTEYYKRFSYALLPFIVAFISSALGGRFKKNILLMSLLTSLGLTVLYYITQMITVLFAKLGYLPPLAGAWAPFLIFLFPGIWLFRNART
ncbi:MAG: YjgP/YjgQ family permease [Spirochaetales bacterium]|nr:MAG: YjgP/YjgQ family permease [Spirochaetales bacterium]